MALAACTYTDVHQGPLDPREAQCRAACDVKRDECDRQSGGGRISGLTCDDEYQQCHAQCQS